MLVPCIQTHRLGHSLFKEDNDILQRPRIFHAGDLAAIGLDHQRIGLIASHPELLHKRGPAIPRVQMHDDEPLGQLREHPVRVRVLLKNPTMLAS